MLSNLKDQYNIAQQMTGVDRMRAQAQASMNSMMMEGVSYAEAHKIASLEMAVAQENATTNVLKQADSIRDQTELLRAATAEDAARTKAAIAYREAISAGADESAAAELSAAVYANEWERATQAAKRMKEQLRAIELSTENLTRLQASAVGGGSSIFIGGASTDDYNNAYGLVGGGGGNTRGSYSFGESDMRGGTFGATMYGLTTRGGMSSMRGSAGNGGVRNNVSFSNFANMAFMSQERGTFNASEYYQRIADNASSGGLEASLRAVQSQRANGSDSFSAQYSIVQQIVQAMNSSTNDRGQQIRNLENELAWLQSTPQSLTRDMAIINLRNSIDDLREATEANTRATVTLNPLYNGRDAISVGYMGAARGMDFTVQGGTPGVDSVPIHIMAQQGERVTVTPVGGPSSGGDNSRTITVNQTFNFGGSSSSARRRSQRQTAQGFGQTIAALS